MNRNRCRRRRRSSSPPVSSTMNESLRAVLTTAATAGAASIFYRDGSGVNYTRSHDEDSVASPQHESLLSMLTHLGDVIIYCLKLSIVVTFLLCSSITHYLLLYYWVVVMPGVLVRVPLYFDYSGQLCSRSNTGTSWDSSVDSVSNKIGRNRKKDCPMNNDVSACYEPVAKADFLAEHTQWIPVLSADTVPDISSRGDQVLQPQRRYYFDLTIGLPESSVNKGLGMFMIESELLSKSNVVIAKSLRSSILPYQSRMVQMFRTFFLLAPIAVGAFPEVRHVSINLFDNFIDHDDEYARGIKIRLIVPQNSQFPKSLQTIQISNAEIVVGKELNTIQKTMKNYFFTCAICGVCALFVTEALFAYLVYLRYFYRLNNHSNHSYSYEEEGSAIGNHDWSFGSDQHSVTENAGRSVNPFDDEDSDNWTQNIDDAVEEAKEDIYEVNSHELNDIDSNFETRRVDERGEVEENVLSGSRETSSNSKRSTNNRYSRDTNKLLENIMKGQYEKFEIFTGIYLQLFHVLHLCIISRLMF